MQHTPTPDYIVVPRPPRPCYADGRRAMFHRWSDTGRPVVPRGQEGDKNAQNFQNWAVHAIVEFEDGTVSRVWPSELQFVDGGDFDRHTWPQEQEVNHGYPFTFSDD